MSKNSNRTAPGVLTGTSEAGASWNPQPADSLAALDPIPVVDQKAIRGREDFIRQAEDGLTNLVTTAPDGYSIDRSDPRPSGRARNDQGAGASFTGTNQTRAGEDGLQNLMGGK